MSAAAHAASAPYEAGQIRPLPSALVPIGRQRAGDHRYRPVERNGSEQAIALDCIARDRANRGHQAKRDGKVVVTSFLGEIGGGESHGDAPWRESATESASA